MARYLTKSSCASLVNNEIHNYLKCSKRVQAEERETDHEGGGEGFGDENLGDVDILVLVLKSLEYICTKRNQNAPGNYVHRKLN